MVARFHCWRLLAVVGVVSMTLATPLFAQDPKGNADAAPKDPYAHLAWQNGPATGTLGRIATIQIPAGYRFTAADGAKEFTRLNGNPPTDSLVGVIAPIKGNDWCIEFDYEDTGYVKDDEKDKIDANAILQSFRSGNEEANRQRRQMGSSELRIIGWDQAPFYDPQTNRLTWAIRCESDGEFVINYNSRLLGREGVMSANLIVAPEDLQAAKVKYTQLLGGFTYVPGKRYSEFRAGDRVAEYGLAALILGGGTAIAAKSGILGKLIKPIVVGVFAIFAAIGKFFKRLFGGSSDESAS
jgi:uncharacterized membrane-anchored protein